jgi:hypothetical protein
MAETKRPNYHRDFWYYVDMSSSPSGCWLWTGKPNRYGYGQLTVLGKTVTAHKHSYEKQIGPVPPGYELDQACDQPLCVCPAHLELVTKQENLRRTRERLGWSRESPIRELLRRARNGEAAESLSLDFVVARKRRSSDGG